MILFTSTSQVIGWEDWAFVPVKWLAGKIISRMTCNVSNGTLNNLSIRGLHMADHLMISSYELLTS